MKTKHLALMALPLFMAACSQEEFESNSAPSAVNDRRVVENVTFKFDEASTRMAFEGGSYTWETGDAFGACLYDEKSENYGKNDVDWFQWFSLVDYVQSNYRFVRQENETWVNTENPMQEGNYFFYYPYNSNKGGARDAILMEVPTEQVIADDAAASTVLDNQLFVAYAPIQADPESEGVTIETLTMEPVLSFPAFSIKNNTGNDFTISRIALVGKVGTAPSETDMKFPTGLNIMPATAKFNSSGFVRTMNATQRRSAVLSVIKTNEDYTTSKVLVVFGENGKKLANNGNYTAYMMVPTFDVISKLNGIEEDETKGLYLEIYTDKGLITVPLGDEVPGDDITVQNPMTNWTYNDGQHSIITLDEDAFETPKTMSIESTSDLEDFVTWNKNTQSTITAEVSGENVELSKAMYDVLNNSSQLYLKVEGTDGAKITIPADAPANALSKVTLSNITVVNKATLDKVKDLTDASVKIVNEGTISLQGKKYSAEFENKGTISIDTELGNNEWVSFNLYSADDTKSRFVNKGTLTINAKDVRATEEEVAADQGWNGMISNQPGANLVIAKGASLNARIQNEKENIYGTYGKMEVNGAWTTYGSKGYNEGEIIVNGSIRVPEGGTFENRPTWDYYVGSKKVEVTPNIIIGDGASVVGITNNGNVQVAANGSYISTGKEGKGLVDNSAISSQVTASENETIYVKVTESVKASELNEQIGDAKAKRVVFENAGTLTVDPVMNADGTVKSGATQDLRVSQIYINGDLTISGTKDVVLGLGNLSGGTQMNILSGTTTISTNTYVQYGSTTSWGTYINIAESAKLDVRSSATLAAEVNIDFQDSKGAVSNYGTITTEEVKRADNLIWDGAEVVIEE